MNMISDLTLTDYLRIIRKRKWIIILCSLIVVAVSSLYVSKETPIYQAKARVKVEQRTTLAGGLMEMMTWSTGDVMATEVETVTSYAVMERVAYKLGKITEKELRYPHEFTKEAESFETQQTPDRVLRIVRGLRGKVSAKQEGITNIISITVTSSDRSEAARLANLIAQEYRNENRYQKQKDKLAAKSFVDSQIQWYEEAIKKSATAEKRFREERDFVTPSQSLNNVLAQLSALEVERTRLELQISQAETKLKQLKEAKTDTGKLQVLFPEIYNHPTLATIRQNISNLEIRLSEFLESATQLHPQAVQMKRSLEKLKSEQKKEIQGLVDASIISTEAQIASLKERVQETEDRKEKASQRLAKIPDEEVKYAQFEREVKMNNEMYLMFKRRSEESRIAEAEQTGNVSIIEPAVEPYYPISSSGKGKIAAGGVVGLLLGFVLAFIIESLDTSIGTIEDLERYLETTVLGVIPYIGPAEGIIIPWRPKFLALPKPFSSRRRPPQGPPMPLITQSNPKLPEAEAFRTLRTTILLKMPQDEHIALLFTSASPQEGKTSIISNLGLTMAQLGKQTILVDCNLRRPALHRVFGVERGPGLTDVLIGSATVDEAIKSASDLLFGALELEDFLETPGIDNLYILPAGVHPPNPAEMLATERMTELINELKSEYDIVIFDTPPTLPVTDATILSAKVDGVILVYRAGKSSRKVPKRAMELIKGAEGEILGVVLNDIKPEIETTPAIYQHYYYYEEEGAEESEA
ncbi:TPA: polysaccharide biosynthesis tyrosine autokinase [Candidatus Poribacteria bacterium]|nr:polysaccharide biosynthesis tyrosine autokinase [Candidatus Poribacteria bacterium]